MFVKYSGILLCRESSHGLKSKICGSDFLGKLCEECRKTFNVKIPYYNYFEINGTGVCNLLTVLARTLLHHRIVTSSALEMFWRFFINF